LNIDDFAAETRLLILEKMQPEKKKAGGKKKKKKKKKNAGEKKNEVNEFKKNQTMVVDAMLCICALFLRS
jgi:hypothetical protein